MMKVEPGYRVLKSGRIVKDPTSVLLKVSKSADEFVWLKYKDKIVPAKTAFRRAIYKKVVEVEHRLAKAIGNNINRFEAVKAILARAGFLNEDAELIDFRFIGKNRLALYFQRDRILPGRYLEKDGYFMVSVPVLGSGFVKLIVTKRGEQPK